MTTPDIHHHRVPSSRGSKRPLFQFLRRRFPHRFSSRLMLLFLGGPILALGFSAYGQDAVAPDAGPAQVVATVNGFEIREQAVDNELQRVLGPTVVPENRRAALRTATIEQLIDRHVVYDFLVQSGLGAGESEIQMQKDALVAELAVVDQSLEEYFAQKHLNRAELEFQFAWHVAWPRYLKQLLTEANLEKHYLKNRRKFDGTELRVAHLLIRRSSDKDPQPQQQAARIRRQIKEGKLTWDAAVEQFSDASREKHGELGWIQIDRPMPPAFNEAAFALEADEISPPVETAFGVHLIRCLEVRPGKLGWRDARETVSEDAARFLFRSIVAQHRDRVTIEKPGA